MTKSLQNQYASASPEQKPAILLHEIAAPMAILQGFAAIHYSPLTLIYIFPAT
jgi:hypothetical protein